MVLATTYKQVFDPVSNSLALTSIFAALPLITLFVLLGVVKLRAWVAGLIALVVALGVAIVVYSMPVGQALDSGLEGAAFGLFPIMWIVINAIWIYNMTVETGHFDVLRRSFAKVSDDQRIQAMIIAFCFGALMEALAGFGTPVAISSVMLIALGFRPIKAATIALVANTAPVAFGALATPIVTLASNAVTNGQFTVDQLGSMVGRQTPILAIFVPLALVAIVDGRRGVRQTWPAALVCGITFGIAQFVCSNYISVPLTDIVASLVSALSLIGFLRVWQPSEHYSEEPYADEPATRGRLTPPPVAGGMSEEVDPDFVARVRNADNNVVDPPREVARAYAPYLIIIAVFALAQLPFLKGTAPTKVGASGTGLESVTRIFHWPGLDLLTSKGKPLSLMNFKFNWLSAGGTLLLIAGLITMLAIGVGLRRAVHAYAATLNQLKWAIVTVMAVLALAYVMNASGQTGTLGRWMAGAGGLFALLSPILGWLGVAVTGSDTSSNALFGGLQVQAAKGTGLNPLLMAASNSSGGVLGKMISPQNLAIAAAAVGMEGREGDLFRRVVLWSLAFLLFMCVLVYLQSTSVLSWMIP
jgi:lactate permease